MTSRMKLAVKYTILNVAGSVHVPFKHYFDIPISKSMTEQTNKIEMDGVRLSLEINLKTKSI